jgi:hypothetical protein
LEEYKNEADPLDLDPSALLKWGLSNPIAHALFERWAGALEAMLDVPFQRYGVVVYLGRAAEAGEAVHD